MEFVIAGFGALFVVLTGFYIMKDSDETRRRKEFAAERIKRMQAEREAQATAEFERQKAKARGFAAAYAAPVRSAPITTGRSKPGSSQSAQISRRDNSFDDVLDTYTTPTYHSSHSSGGHSYSSHSCSSSSSSSSDSSSSSSDSGGGGCD